MKKAFILLTALFFLGVTTAQEPVPNHISTIQDTPPALPEYLYCEIICNHLPPVKGEGVLLDFGQQTKTWVNNWLQDSKGQKIIFNSSIEALNYLVRRGWEFVQAYTSGEKNQNTHLLLRIRTSRLNETQLQQLLTEPRTKPGNEK